MTLKEKFDNLDYFDSVDIFNNLSHDSHECEKIADQFAIGFAIWLRKVDTQENAERWFGYSDQDMLNEYKQENGL